MKPGAPHSLGARHAAASRECRRHLDEILVLCLAREEKRSELGWRIGRQLPWFPIGLASARARLSVPEERRCTRDVPECHSPGATRQRKRVEGVEG